MNTLNTVIKKFKSIINNTDDVLIKDYYKIIVKFMLLEHKYQSEVECTNKVIYHYFKYHLPSEGRDYFEFLYNPHNPVRFSVETFDSVEEIRIELKR